MSKQSQKTTLGRKLLSASALSVANLAFAALASLVVMPLLVHHLGDHAYGLWSLAAAFISYYSLLDLGLSSAVGQYLSIAIGRKDEQDSSAIFNTAMFIQSLIGLAALLVTAALAVSAHWFCRTPEDAALAWKVIAILGVNAAMGFPVRVYRAVLDAEFRFDLASGIDLLGLILRYGFTVWVVFAGGGLLALAWATFLASLPVMLLQVWCGRRAASWAHLLHWGYERQRTRQLFSYSLYSFGSILADIFRFQIDALVISAMVSVAAVTHYRIATIFSNYYVNALVSVSGLFQPIMSRMHGAGDRAGLERTFLFASKVSIVVSVFLCVAVVAWGQSFIARWMGLRYEDAYVPMVILSVAVFLDVFQGASVGFLYAIFKHRYYMYLNGAEGVINLVCSLLLARSYGIVGVAYGTLIGAVVIRGFVQPVVVCRVSGFSLRRYARFLSFNIVRAAVVMAVVIAVFRWAIRPSYPWLIASSLAGALLYGAGSLFGVFTREERVQLFDGLRNRQRQMQEAPAIAVVGSRESGL